MTPRPARLLAALPLLLAAALLSACTPIVAMTSAPDANTPGCAEISVRLPDTVAGKAQRFTDAQATSAWGDPAVVLLHCGVPPIGPTTKPCTSVNGVDWVLENDPAASALRYITFGRTPATEIVIQHGAGGVSDASVLADLSQAVSSVPQSKNMKCLDVEDVPGPTGTAVPAPTPPAPTLAAPTPPPTAG